MRWEATKSKNMIWKLETFLTSYGLMNSLWYPARFKIHGVSHAVGENLGLLQSGSSAYKIRHLGYIQAFGDSVFINNLILIALSKLNSKDLLEFTIRATSESVDWFIQDQAFSASNDLAPPQPLAPAFSPVSKHGRQHAERLRKRRREKGWGRSQIIRLWESLFHYK